MDQLTERKFSMFSFKKKHKLCAELLFKIYEKLLTQKSVNENIHAYQEMLSWLNEFFTQAFTLTTVADQYHYHLQCACQRLKEHRLLPRQGDRLSALKAWPIAIYLDNLRSAHNVGSIIRTVEAFSLGSLYFSPSTPYITHKQVVDTSMGTAGWVVCQQNLPLKELLRPIIVLETAQDALPLDHFIFPESFTLVIGNEEYGCSDSSLDLADYVIEIPLRGRKNSLNVANAFAIVAAEISKQKRAREHYEET